jgi:hypothetical protein
MVFVGRSKVLVCLLALITIFVTTSFTLNTKILSVATKRIAAAAIVAVGLTGVPDQFFSFSSATTASAAETKSIFDGLYNDPNHPGCLVSSPRNRSTTKTRLLDITTLNLIFFSAHNFLEENHEQGENCHSSGFRQFGRIETIHNHGERGLSRNNIR